MKAIVCKGLTIIPLQHICPLPPPRERNRGIVMSQADGTSSPVRQTSHKSHPNILCLLRRVPTRIASRLLRVTSSIAMSIQG